MEKNCMIRSFIHYYDRSVVHPVNITACRLLILQPERKIWLGRPKHRREDIIKVDFEGRD
jgi:hypothetical protein